MLRAHKIMIEQGSAWAILGLNDRGEKPGTSAFRRWLHAEKDSTGKGKIKFTSDSHYIQFALSLGAISGSPVPT